MVNIKVEWNSMVWHKPRFGVVVGIHLHEPEPGIKYPYVAYDYTKTPCVEWDLDNNCLVHTGDLPEGTLVYMYNYIQKTRRLGKAAIAIGKVKEGAYYVRGSKSGFWGSNFWKAENIEPLIEDHQVMLDAVELYSAAKRRDWSIARTTATQNLIAVWLVENGYVSEIPVSPVERKIAVALDMPWR